MMLQSRPSAGTRQHFAHILVLAHVMSLDVAYPMTSDVLNRLSHVLMQRRLTFQWDLWSGRPLISLAAVEQAACRFLQSAATVLASNGACPLRQVKCCVECMIPAS